MTIIHTQSTPEDASSSRRPALFIIRSRVLYGERGLSQKALAELAGVPESVVAALERAATLPREFEQILRIALSLQVPVESLVDERLLARIGADIARGRALLDEDPERCLAA